MIYLKKIGKFPSIKHDAYMISSQFKWGLLFLGVNVAGMYFFYNYKPVVVLPWLFGLLFGFVLQRSRFCFAAAFRDIFLIGNTSLTRAMILGLIVATTGFLILEILAPGANFIYVYGKVKQVGIFTAVGAFLFGVGMVIGASCTSPCLKKLSCGGQRPARRQQNFRSEKAKNAL